VTAYEATDWPLHLSDYSVIVRGDISREEAADRISNELGEDVKPEDLGVERIRYGYPPEDVEWDGDGCCWYTGASGHGSKKVWILNCDVRRRIEK
jgi:hypothetical protein